MWFQRPVKIIEHDPGPHHAPPPFHVDIEDLVEMDRVVEDQCRIDGLTTLRGARPPRKDGDPLLARNIDRRGNVLL